MLNEESFHSFSHFLLREIKIGPKTLRRNHETRTLWVEIFVSYSNGRAAKKNKTVWQAHDERKHETDFRFILATEKEEKRNLK